MTVLQVPPLELKYPTLGPQVADFIHAKCVFGPGSRQDEPAELDPETKNRLSHRGQAMQQLIARLPML